MKFKLTANAYIKVPTDIGEGVVKSLDHFYQASASAPLILELPSNLSLDSISRRWEPLDDEARAAQAKLTPIVVDTSDVPAAAAPLDGGGILAALGNLSNEEKAKLIAALGGKPKAAGKKNDAE